MIFRQATHTDTARILEIIQQAQAQMHALGSSQWQNGYPAPANIEADLVAGCGFVLADEHAVQAYGAAVFGEEPAYLEIEGRWLSENPYVVVHRLAVADGAKGHGVATEFMRQVEAMSHTKGIHSFRIDTNFDNRYMLQMITTLGFTHCGTVYYNQSPRLAFEKLL
ncbi:MAG: GNAT family N-acetyltransferase [Alistipes sp.]